MMYGLTVIQPWAWAIAHGGKDVENRSWPYPHELHRHRIAIHAGKGYRPDAEEWLRYQLRRLVVPAEECHVKGAVVCTAVLDGFADRITPGGWYEGNGLVGWKLRDVLVLREPVACRGYQKLWRLPSNVEAQVGAQGGW